MQIILGILQWKLNDMHRALTLEKECNFKSTKTHYLHFQKWQKINFCTRKKSENCIFKLFSGAKIDFLPFLKWQKMCFCTFEIARFSNFRALWHYNHVDSLFSITEIGQKWRRRRRGHLLQTHQSLKIDGTSPGNPASW